MKSEITGYLTGLINNHNRIVGSMKKFGYSNASIQIDVNYTNELTDLLAFVEKTPEETQQPMTVILNNIEENELLRKQIRELEDSCENMNEVEKNLHKKIKVFEEDAIKFKEQALDDKERIIDLENEYQECWETNKRLNVLDKERQAEKGKLIDINKSWQKKYNHVNEINVNLLGELNDLKDTNITCMATCRTLNEKNEILEQIIKDNKGCVTCVNRKELNNEN